MNKNKIILIVLASIIGLFILSTILYPTISNMQEEQESSQLTDEQKAYLADNDKFNKSLHEKDENGSSMDDKLREKFGDEVVDYNS